MPGALSYPDGRRVIAMRRLVKANMLAVIVNYRGVRANIFALKFVVRGGEKLRIFQNHFDNVFVAMRESRLRWVCI
jgi:hypothetical protein